MSTILDALGELETSSITVSVLEALDTVVPGEWQNCTDFDEMIPVVIGHDQQGIIDDVRNRAIALIDDSDRDYEMALWLFQKIDTMDKVAAGATVASKVTDLFGGLDFVKQFTPKPETTQALDAGLKLIAELMAFGFLKGLPELTFEEIALFVIELQKYGKADLMRIAAWIIIDGMLPLGPNFMSKIVDTIENSATSEVAGHSIFDTISEYLPGDDDEEKMSFVTQALRSTSEFIGKFIEEHNITDDLIQEKLGDVVDMVDGGSDYVAAALDASTNYFSHTGTQTVARSLIEEAYAQLKEDVWQNYLNQHG